MLTQRNRYQVITILGKLKDYSKRWYNARLSLCVVNTHLSRVSELGNITHARQQKCRILTEVFFLTYVETSVNSREN